MNLFEKIVSIYPELAEMTRDNPFFTNQIILQNDSDGRGDYIKFWNHPTLSQPTQEQLDGVSA